MYNDLAIGGKIMKKLALEFIASFLLMILMIMVFMIVILSGRGYTKDNLEYRSKVIDLSGDTRFENLSKSVVQIYASKEGSSAFGTGFFINSENKIITNYYVIEGAKCVYVTMLDDKYAYKADLYA
jgi:S1-C subfamily serine protease